MEKNDSPVGPGQLSENLRPPHCLLPCSEAPPYHAPLGLFGVNLAGKRPLLTSAGQPKLSRQPDMLAAAQFGTLHRFPGGKCGSQLCAVRFAPHESVTAERQARP
jgi:hypothetical protein